MTSAAAVSPAPISRPSRRSRSRAPATLVARARKVTGPFTPMTVPCSACPAAFDAEKSSEAGPARASSTETTRPDRIAASVAAASAAAVPVRRSPGRVSENVRKLDS